jgi:hypothetical protein
MPTGDDVRQALTAGGFQPPDGLADLADGELAQVALIEQWWMSLPTGTRGVFEGVAFQKPDLFSQALTGNATMLAIKPDTDVSGYLRTFVEGLGPLATLPIIMPVDPVAVCEPAEPEPNQPFKIKWTEVNQGGPSQAYEDEVSLAGATMGAPVKIDRPALGAGATAEVEHTVEAGLAAGTWTVTVRINVDEAAGHLGSLNGAGGVVSGQIVIGGVDTTSATDKIKNASAEIGMLLGAMPPEVTNPAQATEAAAKLARVAERMAKIAPDATAMAGHATSLGTAQFTAASNFAAVDTAVKQAADGVLQPLGFAVSSAEVLGDAAHAHDDLVAAATALDAAVTQILAAQ